MHCPPDSVAAGENGCTRVSAGSRSGPRLLNTGRVAIVSRATLIPPVLQYRCVSLLEERDTLRADSRARLPAAAFCFGAESRELIHQPIRARQPYNLALAEGGLYAPS